MNNPNESQDSSSGFWKRVDLFIYNYGFWIIVSFIPLFLLMPALMGLYILLQLLGPNLRTLLTGG